MPESDEVDCSSIAIWPPWNAALAEYSAPP